MDMMMKAAVELLIELGTAILTAVAGVLVAKISGAVLQAQRLEALKAAREETEAGVHRAVDALNQTTVKELKAAAADGKLTREEIEQLGQKLQECVLETLSAPAKRLLEAAGTDLAEFIRSAAEAYIAAGKEQHRG